jgi:hypothetical protein
MNIEIKQNNASNKNGLPYVVNNLNGFSMKALIIAATVLVTFSSYGYTDEIKAQHGNVITPQKTWCDNETLLIPLSGHGVAEHFYVEDGAYRTTPVDYYYTLRTETDEGYTIRVEPSLEKGHNIAGALALKDDALKEILQASLFVPVQYACGSLAELNEG